MDRRPTGLANDQLVSRSATLARNVINYSSAVSSLVAITLSLLIAGCGHTVNKLPPVITLRQIDGGPHYFAHISPKSSWMDRHILLGAWLEQPLDAADVASDRAVGDNIYWNLAGFDQVCGDGPCVASYEAIRDQGMHVSAPNVTMQSGRETVAYDGSDEADMKYGPGWGNWDRASNRCIPAGSKCGYTVVRWYYTGQPAGLGNPGYPEYGTVKHQGYGKGVLFWDTKEQAAKFLKFTDRKSVV